MQGGQNSKPAKAGLPPALLTKWKTPFDHSTTKLKGEFLPLESYPNHLTEEKCIKIHAIYTDAIQETMELERIVSAKLTMLKRKRARETTTVGWETAAPKKGGGNGHQSVIGKGGNSAKSSSTKKDREGGGGSKHDSLGGGGGSSKKSKKKNRSNDEEKVVAPASSSVSVAGAAAVTLSSSAAASSATTPKKKKKKKKEEEDDKSAPRWPAWSTRTPKPGDQVAAKVDNEDLWILAKVEKFLASQNMFLVVDDDGGLSKHRQFKLKRSNILTFPRPGEASGKAFPPNTKVMALYPNTTTFYPATISAPSIESRDGDLCVMQFQDDELTPEGILPHWSLPAHLVRPPPLP